MTMMRLFAVAAALGLGTPALAQGNEQPSSTQAPAETLPATDHAALAGLRPPVVAGDVTGRPYRILGVVSANVRKATIFSRAPSQAHVYRELWERAERLGADAVINARYGDARITAMSWGARRSEGQAIKFLTDAEIAARGGTTAPTPAPAQ